MEERSRPRAVLAEYCDGSGAARLAHAGSTSLSTVALAKLLELARVDGRVARAEQNAGSLAACAAAAAGNCVETARKTTLARGSHALMTARAAAAPSVPATSLSLGEIPRDEMILDSDAGGDGGGRSAVWDTLF
eukprot:scaffold100434_cov31-Tisochrysis_lutea.AAC.1